jgi:hypothetical protein
MPNKKPQTPEGLDPNSDFVRRQQRLLDKPESLSATYATSISNSISARRTRDTPPSETTLALQTLMTRLSCAGWSDLRKRLESYSERDMIDTLYQDVSEVGTLELSDIDGETKQLVFSNGECISYDAARKAIERLKKRKDT